MKHMAIVVAGLPGASDVMISRTNELEERILGLLEGLRIILNRVSPLPLHIPLLISYVKVLICFMKSEFFNTSFLGYIYNSLIALPKRRDHLLTLYSSFSVLRTTHSSTLNRKYLVLRVIQRVAFIGGLAISE